MSDNMICSSSHYSPYSVFRYVHTPLFALEQYPCSHDLSFPNYFDIISKKETKDDLYV